MHKIPSGIEDWKFNFNTPSSKTIFDVFLTTRGPQAPQLPSLDDKKPDEAVLVSGTTCLLSSLSFYYL